MKIELLSVPNCAHVDEARALLRDCLASLNLQIPIDELVGSYASPTILVDGRDVMGRADRNSAACRLDVPTRERVLAALTGADA